MVDTTPGYDPSSGGSTYLLEPRDYSCILIDEPAEGVRRITLNRPDKRNAINHALRGDVMHALTAADIDDSVRVSIVRGAGTCFSAGYDLGGGNAGQQPAFYSAQGDGYWARYNIETWMQIWDLAKPVIAQVHGYCLAGGSELATGCDLVYVAKNTRMGYPAVRFGVPDMHFHPWLLGMRLGMEMLLTGDSISGEEAAARGWATRCYDDEELESEVLTMATRIAQLPADIVQLNKRAVHRQMEVMGLRSGMRAGAELCTLGVHQQSFTSFMANTGGGKTLTKALQERDEAFGDYRTKKKAKKPDS